MQASSGFSRPHRHSILPEWEHCQIGFRPSLPQGALYRCELFGHHLKSSYSEFSMGSQKVTT
eukprot:5501422-Amphidinium_carterae.1